MLKEMREIVIEVVMAVVPIIVVITLLNILVIRIPAGVLTNFLAGAVLVTAGLLLFIVGVRIGLLPIGEMIGSETVGRGSLVLALCVAFILGFAVTVAEPDVRVLAYQVDLASGGYIKAGLLITTVSLGVALFIALAVLRTLAGIPIAYLLAGGYGLVIILSFFTPPHFVAISFDAGGVTTGPMAVPFILALGIGTASVLGGKSSLADGFGLVGLASIGPIITVMLLGVIFG